MARKITDNSHELETNSKRENGIWGAAVDALLKKKQIKQKELASELGVTSSAITLWKQRKEIRVNDCRYQSPGVPPSIEVNKLIIAAVTALSGWNSEQEEVKSKEELDAKYQYELLFCGLMRLKKDGASDFVVERTEQEIAYYENF